MDSISHPSLWDEDPQENTSYPISSSTKTHCIHGHALVEGNLLLSSNQRQCLTCHRERQRKYREWKRTGSRPQPPPVQYCTQGHPLVECNLQKTHNGWKRCLTCHREQESQRYHQNSEEAIAKSSAYAKKNPDKVREDKRRHELKRKYGLTPLEWFMLLESQAYLCALCGKPLHFTQDRRNVVVDHNHTTGKVRGLIHTYCNILLGTLENTDLLQAAFKYLEDDGVYGKLRGFVDRLEEDHEMSDIWTIQHVFG